MPDKIIGKLPDVFRFNNGKQVVSAADWEKRRKEILEGPLAFCYGAMPPEPEYFKLRELSVTGKLSTYKIITGTKEKQLSIYLRVYRPNVEGKVPVVLDGDGCWQYINDDIIGEVNSHGYALAVFDRTELVRDIWADPTPRACDLYEVYPDIDSGTIAGWAWGFLRCMDALVQLDYIDRENIAVTGHSRGGKTAMLAGVVDKRAKYVCANGSGAGGAGCWHYITLEPEVWQDADNPARSETLDDMCKNFPNWLGQKMHAYRNRDGELPFDQHFFKALVAPRYFLQTEGFADVWANSKGTYQTYLAAKEVYKLLGVEDHILSHFRDGGHYHRLSDFQLLLNVMDHEIKGTPLSALFCKEPFPGMEKIF
ncbi:MAG: hypothetical protein E7487_09410 [Ruminococcaceae bacterium]|nr:hypothetical protein [Oscillospiraceae bacterium]